MISIERESFNAVLYEEILPLAQKCWEESTSFKAESCAFYGERDFNIEPDFETYRQLDDSRRLIIITLRDNDEIKGYVIGFLYQSWHHKKLLCGNADSIYLEPDYRSYAIVLTEKIEREMREHGACIIGWPTHPASPVYELLKASGYVGDDIVMEKRLCVLQ